MRKKAKNRSKKLTTRDRAWNVFSLFIRNRDKKCVTCGGKPENAGHFWHNVLDFDEENINAQCVRCNHWLSGNLAIYSVYLLNKLGEKRFKALEKRHWEAIKGELHDEDFYLQIIEKYAIL